MFLKPLHLQKACVLVLERDPNRRASLCSLLADRGYRLADGIDGADASHGRIDLVLAGIGSGEAAIQAQGCRAPVIALVDRAAWACFNFLDAANDLGAVAVLQWPFSGSALLRLIATVLHQASDGSGAPECRDEESVGLAELLRRLEDPYPA